jgi:hypothetical protein
MRFAKQDGTWLIEAKSMAQSPEQSQGVCRFFRGFTSILREAAADAGRPGATPESLNEQLADKMFDLIF